MTGISDLADYQVFDNLGRRDPGPVQELLVSQRYDWVADDGEAVVRITPHPGHSVGLGYEGLGA